MDTIPNTRSSKWKYCHSSASHDNRLTQEKSYLLNLFLDAFILILRYRQYMWLSYNDLGSMNVLFFASPPSKPPGDLSCRDTRVFVPSSAW
jgi:hypothetical protein